MIPITVPNRPFSTEPISGFMLPDGIFEASLGKQRLNAHFMNIGASALTNTNIYVESVSNPGILVTFNTYHVASLIGGASTLLSWDIDVSAAPPGIHYVSFIAQSDSDYKRIIKKIFVTRVQFNPNTNTFIAQAPEGTLEVRIKKLFGPEDPCCGIIQPATDKTPESNIFNQLGPLVQKALENPSSRKCLPVYLLEDAELIFSYNPPFAGKYGDLPFQDPWLKILLIIIFALLGITAIVLATLLAGPIVIGSITIASICCSVAAVIAFGGALAGSVTALIAAGLKDERDPFRRGQDNTIPALGELTTGEQVNVSLSYPESVTSGKPFAVNAKWDYTRITTGSSYSYSVSETNTNIHVLSKYVITAPNVIHAYKKEPFIVKGQFFGPDEKTFQGDQLFVQCILEGTGALEGRYYRFTMQDDGIYPDEKPGDGVYTGIHYFDVKDRGLWMIYVIAQDVNNAQPDMTPEEAAKIIGGMVLTHQLTITFNGGTCPLVPDGDVNVI